jgi:hypothetical protein
VTKTFVPDCRQERRFLIVGVNAITPTTLFIRVMAILCQQSCRIKTPYEEWTLPMTRWLVCLLALLLGMNSHVFSEAKGSCPPAPRKTGLNSTADVPHNPHHQDDTFAGTVSILAVINGKGYACRAQLIRGFDKAVDREETRTAQKWHFPPARRGGHPVPTLFGMDVDYWHNACGDLVRGSERIGTSSSP